MKNKLAIVIFVVLSVVKPVQAGVSNTSANFSYAIARDLFDVLPFPENMEFMHQVKCRNGVIYASEGSSGGTGWSVATAVCQRGKDKNSAIWVLHVPEMTSYAEGRGNTYTMVKHDGGYVRPGTVGLDCTFISDGWSCKKTIETEGLIFIITRDKNYQLNDSAYDYAKVIGAKRSGRLKPYVTD